MAPGLVTVREAAGSPQKQTGTGCEEYWGEGYGGADGRDCRDRGGGEEAGNEEDCGGAAEY